MGPGYGKVLRDHSFLSKDRKIFLIKEALDIPLSSRNLIIDLHTVPPSPNRDAGFISNDPKKALIIPKAPKALKNRAFDSPPFSLLRTSYHSRPPPPELNEQYPRHLTSIWQNHTSEFSATSAFFLLLFPPLLQLKVQTLFILFPHRWEVRGEIYLLNQFVSAEIFIRFH